MMLIGCLAAIFTLGGCLQSEPSTADVNEADLVLLGKTMVKLSWADCKDAHTGRDFFDIAYRKRLLAEIVDEDRWSSVYHLGLEKHDDRLVLTIISNGQNRRFENGNGDDMSCKVVIAKSGANTYQTHRN
jgi:hypothetical protein